MFDPSRAATVLPEKTDALFERRRDYVSETRAVTLNLPVKNGERLKKIRGSFEAL